MQLALDFQKRSGEMVVEAVGLSKNYGEKVLFSNVNLNIRWGEHIAIVGPNGSGKTTLLRAITRILKPRKGAVFFDRRNIWQMRFKELARQIAVIPQSFGGMDMSVEGFVLLGRIPHLARFQFLESKKDFDIAERCMNLTDTFKLKDQLISEISGGERQLCLIARALTQEPNLLLLDEPTAHLDIAHQVKILDLIKRLNKEFGLTVIMVLHDLNLASEYCDRIALFNNGTIHKIGTPQEVLSYQNIEEVYKTVVVVKENPISHKPYVFLVPGKGEKINELFFT